ncbi:MAG: hypothetical protein IKL20_06310 [Alistipes sp.]|nr:hypothetical protein [Alistipes sp.]
MRYRTPAMPY